MIKLIATDVDGTLVKDASPDIYPEIIEMVRELRRRDIIKASIFKRPSIRSIGDEILIPEWKDRLKVTMAGEDWVDFMDKSVDGKISPGATDEVDYDKDFPNIEGLKEGLHQYYEIEQTTDLWSFNTGRVQQKMGVNKNGQEACEFSSHC